MSHRTGLVVANLRLLERAEELLARVPAAAHAGGEGVARPTGPHFRHVLEHYSCFLAGVGARRVDYDSRPREAELEVDPAAARRRVRELIGGLGALDESGFETPLEVRLECGEGVESDQWSRSTVRRELQFLLSHTVHHYALIGLLLDQQGIDPGPDFGVAPSTLRHWREQAACAPHPG
jgi:hypothetical protein